MRVGATGCIRAHGRRYARQLLCAATHRHLQAAPRLAACAKLLHRPSCHGSPCPASTQSPSLSLTPAPHSLSYLHHTAVWLRFLIRDVGMYGVKEETRPRKKYAPSSHIKHRQCDVTFHALLGLSSPSYPEAAEVRRKRFCFGVHDAGRERFQWPLLSGLALWCGHPPTKTPPTAAARIRRGRKCVWIRPGGWC